MVSGTVGRGKSLACKIRAAPDINDRGAVKKIKGKGQWQGASDRSTDAGNFAALADAGETGAAACACVLCAFASVLVVAGCSTADCAATEMGA